MVVKRSEVEDVVEATEAVWARRAESSRVRRFTWIVFVRVFCVSCFVWMWGDLFVFVGDGSLDVRCFLVLSRVLGGALLR